MKTFQIRLNMDIVIQMTAEDPGDAMTRIVLDLLDIEDYPGYLIFQPRILSQSVRQSPEIED